MGSEIARKRIGVPWMGSPLFPGEVLVQGNRIKVVAKGRNQLKADGAEIVDGGGATLMPGLTEAHAHLSFTNCASVLEMGDLPIVRNTRFLLRGTQSCCSIAALQVVFPPPRQSPGSTSSSATRSMLACCPGRGCALHHRK